MQAINHNGANAKIVVIIPAYNETGVLAEVVTSLLQKSYRVIVVDDGSTTPLQSLISHLPVHYLRHRANLGQGAALQTGFEFAKKLDPDYIISFDADGQHTVDNIPLLIGPLLRAEVDVALGSRFLASDNNSIPSSRKIVLQLARVINFLFSGLWLTDAHNGLRAFNRTAINNIIITENRMAHATQLLFEIKQKGLRFKEIPVQIHYTDYSKQKGQSSWNSIRIVFDLILHKLFK